MSGISGERVVAVFGSSAPAPGSEDYCRAHEVGRLLAVAGFTVINGGYGGVMEASARGAREAGGRTVGVTTRAFRQRSGVNPFIEREFNEADLYERTRRLIETADAYIALPGGSGTLSELTFLWALVKADLLGPKPILLLGEVWETFLSDLRRLGLVGRPEAAATRLVRTPAEAVESLGRLSRPQRESSS